MTVTDYIVKCALGKNVRQTDGLSPFIRTEEAQGRNLNQRKLANMGRIDLVGLYFTGKLTQASTASWKKFTGRSGVATFVAIRNAKQTRGAMAGAMGCVAQDESNGVASH